MAELDDITFPDPTERVPAILVVDDEVLIRMVLSDYLQDCGFKILEAGTVSEAIAIIEAGTTIIDLVFSDVNMPGGKDGIELAQWIKTNRPQLPVLLTSGDDKKAEMAGAICAKEEFLPKPYDHKVAVARVRALIRARRRSL